MHVSRSGSRHAAEQDSHARARLGSRARRAAVVATAALALAVPSAPAVAAPRVAQGVMTSTASAAGIASTVASTLATSAATSAAPDLTGANLDFEAGLDGWTTSGTVTAGTDAPQSGSGYARLAAGSSVSRTLTGIPQGSYTLSVWLDGTASNNTATLTATDTGAPDATALLDVYLTGDGTWSQAAHRNVLVYNGQLTVTVTSGSAALDVDSIALTLDAADANPVQNWGFESGLDGWQANDATKAVAVTTGADAGSGAVQLAAGGEVSQTVDVEPNTKYVLTARTRVDRQDTYDTTQQTDQYGPIGYTSTRTGTGDRVNVGVRTASGQVLRQAPAGTTGYSLVPVTFTTGPDDHQVTVYANTIRDQAYLDSVGIYTGDDSVAAPADDWAGNGTDHAWVDNIDMFTLTDDSIRGADVSNLQVLEDHGAAYYANGVQQDALRILANRGVSSVTGMIFVHAGEQLYDDYLNLILIGDKLPDGSVYPDTPKVSHDGYFDKVHTVALAERADALGMSFLPSFHYSDAFMSSGKASTPYEWLDRSYDGTLANSDLAHMRSIVYNYVYDVMTALKQADVDVIGVKQGNEQNNGIVWPIGKGATSLGHAALIAASHDAIEAAWPGLSGYVHTNNGYSTSAATSFFGGLLANGATFDGAAFSLYGGRSSANILTMAETLNADPSLRYLDYVNVETAMSFTKHRATWATENFINPEAQYYRGSVNGQYNWLLDYMQAPFDVPNPYGRTRGFYYWEIDWIPVDGIGSKQYVPIDISSRTMFNNGDTSIREMGSAEPGKAGDALDSLDAYLMRGVVKDKTAEMHTPLDEPGVHAAYAVEATAPQGIALTDGDLALAVGDTERLEPVLSPADQVLTDSRITYTSADPGVASVTADGFVVATAPGQTTVSAADAAGHTAVATVTVSGAQVATGADLTVSVDGTPVTDGQTLPVGVLTRLQLTTTLGAGITDPTLVLTSSDPGVAHFLGETWQTPPGTLRAFAGDGHVVQLDVDDSGTTDVTVATADGGAALTFHLQSTKVAVTGVRLDQESLTVGIGATAQLTATVEPADASLDQVTWASSAPDVVTVDASGLVTGVGEGAATVTVTSVDNPDAVASATVQVVGVQVSSVTLNASSITLQAGASRAVEAEVLPTDAADPSLTWTSTDDAVATVDATGVITAVTPGEVDVTATTNDGTDLTATVHVTVVADAVDVTALALDVDTLFVRSDWFSDDPAGDAPTRTLAVTVTPSDATNADIVWASDTPQVATVDQFGVVRFVSPGVAVITATTRDGSVSTEARVHVPAISESFESRASSYTWGLTAVTDIASMGAKVSSGSAGKALVLNSASGSGASARQKVLAEPVANSQVVADFVINVGTPGSTAGAYFALTDSAGHRYLVLRTDKGGELAYGSGGVLDATNAGQAIDGLTAVGTGFNVNNRWYKVHVEVDNEAQTLAFTVTARDDAALTAEHTMALDEATEFGGDLARIQLWTPSSSSGVWWPCLDEVNVYALAPVAKQVSVTPTSVRLIPVSGTLGVSQQLSATVSPSTAPQDLTWTSSDPDVVTVSDTGLVTATHVADSLDGVVPGTAVVTVASASEPSVDATVRVEVTATPHASEQFNVLDEDGRAVYPSDDPLVLMLDDVRTLTANPTGGDGATDIANIEWTSSNPTSVALEPSDAGPASVEVHAVRGGSATVTVTVWLYTTSTPLVAEIPVSVEGDPWSEDTLAPGRAVLSNTAGWAYGLHDGNYDVTMNLWWGVNARLFKLYENGELIATIPLEPDGLNAQHASVPIAGRPDGTYVYTGELVNGAGSTATTSTTVKVTDAAPGTPSVRVEGSGDTLTLLTDLWWGTNGTGYRVYVDGELFASGDLVAATPAAQHVETSLAGLGVGKHTVVSELVNDAGATRSKPLTVTVK
ncbi:Ig-like domain-containing protein [Actinotalea sp. M2MS4P-6]|uniref:Ig-like domain-containing protein n=1 Tax=Actinotalea sp. M2MS4P-6 TaxID=2983762 RepID=UPI0021E41590|nr:Ig-like domain-containing protein [Actinotalea sp. M2MS4P-6]MCV2394441.1 Ig-like domain-containing protein [Actinotalea sp. M2MS4P-6]